VQELAERSGVDLALLEPVASRFARAVELGHGSEDMAATWYATRQGR
jgi:hypothetical protein